MGKTGIGLTDTRKLEWVKEFLDRQTDLTEKFIKENPNSIYAKGHLAGYDALKEFLIFLEEV